MFESITAFIVSVPPQSLFMLLLAIIAIIILIPRTIQKSRFTKLGPIQIEQENQTQNHITNKRIEQVDRDNREELWDMTEELVAEVFLHQDILCHAITSTLINTILSPMRTMILLNHIAPKLIKLNEQRLREKINRCINKGFRDIKLFSLPSKCPSGIPNEQLNAEKYKDIIDRWLSLAREITSKSCIEKIKIYQEAINITQDDHWHKVFTSCKEKNIFYIKEMGFNFNQKSLSIERQGVDK